MARISNYSEVDFTHSLFGTWIFPASLFFLGLPLLRGIFCWGDKVSNVFPFCITYSTPGSKRCYILASTGKGENPFGSLGAPVVSENES
jgi:hypothetical protein